MKDERWKFTLGHIGGHRDADPKQLDAFGKTPINSCGLIGGPIRAVGCTRG